MICAKCGNWIDDGNASCPNCGTPITGEGNMQQPNVSPDQGMNESNLSKKEFLKHPNMKSVRKEINGCGICIFVLAAVNIAFTLFLGYSSWLDIILMVVLGLGIYFLQSRVCSVILAVYGVINVIYFAINNGGFGGYLFLIAGIYSCIYTFKFHKAWREYKKTGVVPTIGKK